MPHPLLPDISPQIAPGWYYLCVGAAVLLTGISKAGFGTGVGMVAIPLMVLVMPPQHMLGVMLPLLIAADILSNLHYLRECQWKLLPAPLLGLVLGIGGGSVVLHFWLLHFGDSKVIDRHFHIIIGMTCLTFIGLQAYRLTGRQIPILRPHPTSGLFVGSLAGFVSTITHAAGPIVTLYMLQLKLAKRQLVATLLIYFLSGNTMKLPSFIGMGLINKQTLLDSIWFIPLLPIGTLTGAWLNRHLPERPFNVVLYVIAATSAGVMLYRGLA